MASVIYSKNRLRKSKWRAWFFDDQGNRHQKWFETEQDGWDWINSEHDDIKEINLQKKKKVMTTEDAIELFKSTIISEVKSFPELKVDKFIIPTGKGTPETMGLMLSDSQLGHLTKSFNFKVFRDRLKMLQESIFTIAKVQRADHPIDRLVIFVLGDIVHNEIVGRFVDLHELEGTVWQQIQVAVDPENSFPSFFHNMLQMFDKVDLYLVSGNHGETQKDSISDANWDSVIYKFWEQQFVNEDRINFHSTDDFYQIVDIYGKKFFLEHGEVVRCWMGLPYYGVSRRIGELAKSEINFNYYCIGHFHQIASIQLGRKFFLVNGSFVSDDMYVLRKYGSTSVPFQYSFFVHPKKKYITSEYKLHFGI